MEILENISEYYDELFPVSEAQKRFFEKEAEAFHKPVKLLSVNCGSGVFEHQMATNGMSVTAIESVESLLVSANRRRRTQVMTLNFFKMLPVEMVRFLGKNFFNIVCVLNDRLILIGDSVLMEKFFYDCSILLSDGGKLIFSIPNFGKYDSDDFFLPERKSIRVRLESRISKTPSGKVLEQRIENGNGRIFPVTIDARITEIREKDIREFAKKFGFKKITLYSDFDRAAFSPESSDTLLCVLEK